jgi:5-methylcytosine-specific restriction enzyme subunit McrC
MRRLSLREYQTAPAVELSTDERTLLQRVAPSVSVTPTAGTDDRYDLTPGSVIGTVALDTVAIEIRPKVPLDRVFFLLSYTLDPSTWRERAFDFGTAATVFEAIVPAFVSQVRHALLRGVLQGYRTDEDSLQTVRGRIRIDSQLRRWYGRTPPIEVRYDEYTEDIDANRLLKAAIARLGRLRLRSAWARAALRSFDHALERVSLVEYDPRQLPQISYSRLNERYRGAVELAKLILRSMSLELGHGDARGQSFLIDMNAVFEDFVVTALRERLRLSEHAFPQGAAGRRLYLDENGRVRLEPDLSWWENNRCVFVGDVKYKRVQVAQIKHPDLYQLLAYTIAADLPGGLLVYAADEETAATHTVIRLGKRLRVATLDVRGEPDEILMRVSRLASEIRGLCQEGLRRAA